MTDILSGGGSEPDPQNLGMIKNILQLSRNDRKHTTSAGLAQLMTKTYLTAVPGMIEKHTTAV